jgi:threonine aldolase
VEDHANAKRFAEIVAAGRAITVTEPESNIVMLDLRREDASAEAAAARLATAGVRLAVYGPRRLRAVMHLDVSRADVERAAHVITETLR